MILIDKLHSTIRGYTQDRNLGWLSHDSIDDAIYQSTTAILKEGVQELSILKERDRNIRYVIDNTRIDYLEQLISNFQVFDEALSYSNGKFSLGSSPITVDNISYNGVVDIDIVSVGMFKKASRLHLEDSQFPIGTKTSSKSYKILPTTIIADVTGDYVKSPIKNQWTFMEISGNEVFTRNSSTVDVTIDEIEYDNLITKALNLLGIPLRSQSIQQSENAKDLAEKQINDRT